MIINDRFEIKERLGKGGFGEVFLATDLKDAGKKVVVKLLLEQSDERKQSWVEQHFYKEAKALKRIDHPNVARLVDAGQTADGKPFFAMEFIEGCDLRSQIDPNKGLIGGYERVAHIIRELGRAISAAHEKGIYHRDLKPENIMLQKPASIDEEERVKVIDFGIATVKESPDEVTKTTQMMAGSVLYMAPEQIQSRPTAASDIYAMGVIAYEMVTGRPPFMPETTTVAMVQLYVWQKEGVRVKPKDLRPSLPVEAQDLILKALAFQPADRFRTAQEFGDLLADTLTGAQDSLYAHLQTLAFSETIKQASPSTDAAQATTQATDAGRSIGGLRRWLPVILAAMLLITAAVAVPLLMRNQNTSGDPEGQRPSQDYSLSYAGVLQQYKDGKPIGAPLRLNGGISGETFFSKDDGLKFFITPSSDGYLYLVNEETTRDNQQNYTMLFPSQASGNSARVIGQRQIATAECVFDEKAGNERVWIIWSARELPELAAAHQRSIKDLGDIKDKQQIAAILNIIDRYGREKLKLELDSANEQVVLRGNSDVLIYPLNLKHR